MHVNRTTFVKLKYEGLHFHMDMGQLYLDKTNSKSNYSQPCAFIQLTWVTYICTYCLNTLR